MADRDAHRARLVELLAGIDFGARYYAYYEQCRTRGPATPPNLTRDDQEAALAAGPLAFTYRARERFFDHAERHGKLEVGLNVFFAASTAEFILKLRTIHGHVGAPFPLLARRAEQLRDPDFSYSPAAPKLPYSNRDELIDVVQFGIALYQDARRVILDHADWYAAGSS
jgi:hypothetical protein